MAILDLQKRLPEVGRLRMGASEPTVKGGRRPTRLDGWKITSNDRQRLDACAVLYGGTVEPWAGNASSHDLQLLTERPDLPILLMPGQTLSQWWEMWRGGGCVRRCDGQTELISGLPCQCPPYDERQELAAEGKACKPTTRLAVLLPDVPGIGCWRLETHGYYAAVEISGVSNILEDVTRRGVLVPARLRIDQRVVVRDGKTKRFPVPVIDIDVRAPDLLEVVGVARPALGYKPVPALPAGEPPSVAEQVAGMQEPASGRKTTQAAVGKPAARASAEPIVVDVETGEFVAKLSTVSEVEVITDRQRRYLWATIRERGLTEERVKDIVAEFTGQESTKLIPARLFERVLTEVVEVQFMPTPPPEDAGPPEVSPFAGMIDINGDVIPESPAVEPPGSGSPGDGGGGVQGAPAAAEGEGAPAAPAASPSTIPEDVADSPTMQLLTEETREKVRQARNRETGE